jgi:hypothetical protein
MGVCKSYAAAKTSAVKQSIFEAAKDLKKEAEEMMDSRPCHLAQRKIDACRAAGDEACALFWRSVWIYLMSIEYGINRP